MKKIKISKLFSLILILNFFLISNVSSLENKIIIKIENEIITNLDIENEINYLKALNPNLNNLKEERIKLIAKNSLIKEKIKQVEILKYIEEINLDKKFLQKLIKDRYSRLNLNNKNEFLNYLKNFDVDIKVIESKISIEALWNQLIYQRF